MTLGTFYLGTHHPGWLSRVDVPVPLFPSDRTLRKYKTLPVATGPWALDSGGFTELQKYGEWTVPPEEYVARVRRYRDEIGNLRWAAMQDWMCEDEVINGGRIGPVEFVGTHLSRPEHIRNTVENYVRLMELAPDLDPLKVKPGEAYIPPGVQGFFEWEYLACVDEYANAGIDLTQYPLVTLGSVCRREDTKEAGRIIWALRKRGLRHLHGFGIKTAGLRRYGELLDSADSLAWSYGARKRHILLPGCTTHKNCANCPKWALRWRERVIAGATPEPQDPNLIPLFEEIA